MSTNKKIDNNSKKNETKNIIHGMLILLAGTGTARLISIACIPLLTRIYTPDEYGLLSLYTAVISILSPILSLRYSLAIPLPKTDYIATNLFKICSKIIIANTIIISAFIFLTKEKIFPIFKIQDLTSWWWLIAIGLTGSAFYELLCLWSTRKKQYRLISASQLNQTITGETTKIILGLISLKTTGLIIGQIASQSLGAIKIAKSNSFLFKKEKGRKKKKIQILLLKKYKEFAYYRLPSQIMTSVSIQAPIIIIANTYSSQITGQLGLAMTALSLPISLIGNALSRAYYAEIAILGINNAKKIMKITISIQKKLFIIGLPISILIYLFSKNIFELIFGDEWKEAGEFASTLAPFILFQITSSPLMELINILKKQWIYLLLQSLRILGFIAILIILKNFNIDHFEAVKTISYYMSIFYIAASLTIIAMLKKIESNDK